MSQRRNLFLLALVLVLAATPSWGWWDTQIQVVKHTPTVKTLQAEASPNLAGRFVVKDDSAWGGKSVRLEKNGPTLLLEHDCRVSHYVVHVICRAPAPDAKPPLPPVILHLRVTNLRTRAVREWRQRIRYAAEWIDGAHLYFPVYESGKHRVEVFAGPRSRGAILVDFVELKDLFGELPCVGEKKSRNLHTEEEIAILRRQPKSVQLAARLKTQQERAGLTKMTAEQRRKWRQEAFDAIWDSQPPRNLHFGGPRKASGDYVKDAIARAGGVDKWKLRRSPGPWTFLHPKTDATYTAENWRRGEVMAGCAFPDDLTGFHASTKQTGEDKPYESNWAAQALMRQFQGLFRTASTNADAYLRTGNEFAGWEAVCAMLVYCDLYPDIDYESQRFALTGSQLAMNPFGKFRYSGHAIGIQGMVETYDHLFPLIKDNQELADLMHTRIPWIKTPQDVVAFMDTNLLQHVRDCVSRLVIRAGDGDSEKLVGIAALVQGPGKSADWMWDLLFTRVHFRMQNRGGLQDQFISSYTRDGCNYIGSVEYTKASSSVAAEIADVCRRFRALGGKLKFDLSDIKRFPKLAQAAFFPLNRKAAGVYTPRIGDWGTAADPPQPRELSVFRPARRVYLFGWRSTGDPRFAWIIHKWGREDETDAEWAAIAKAAKQYGRDPILQNRTRNMPGFGMCVLEAHPDETDYRKKSAVILRAGVGQGHGHCDQLSILYYSKGCRLLTDNGRRGGSPNSRGSRVHNLVEVDEKDFLNVAYNRTGVGWPEACDEMQGVSYARASAVAESHPYLKVYRRDVALVPVGSDGSYVFDVFRVAGGKVHTWCSEGPVSTDPGMVTFNTEMKAGSPPQAKHYPGAGYEHILHADAPDVLQINIQAAPAAVGRYLGRAAKGQKHPEVFTRSWRLGVKGQAVIRGWASLTKDYTKTGTAHNFVFVRNEGRDELEGAYATVTEGYLDDRPVVLDARPITIPGASGAMAPRAALVKRSDGREDVIYLGGDGRSAAKLAGGVEVQAQFALVSRHRGQVERMSLLGGTKLAADGITIRPVVARYRRKVAEVRVDQNTVILDGPLPPKVLDGATCLVERPAIHNASYIIERVDGKAVRLRGAMQVYQSAIAHFDEGAGRVTPELPPVLADTYPKYYDDLLVVNEAGAPLGKAEMIKGDRWMYLAFPRYMTWRQRLSPKDLVDADGDGRKTLGMYNTGERTRISLGEGKMRTLEIGEKMCDLEITRLSNDGLTIWFKDPPEVYLDSARVPHKSWPYVGMELRTEDGKKVLTAQYPGTEYYFGVRGRDLTKADFPDADGDGRRCIIICDIAPGDTIDTPARVSLQRVAGNRWLLDANCDISITLPANARIGGAPRAKPARAGKAITIPASTFAGGEIPVVMQPWP